MGTRVNARLRLLCIGLVFTGFSLNSAEITQLYYRQDGWGNDGAVITRFGTTGIVINLLANTPVTIWEDDLAVEGWTSLKAQVSQMGNAQAYPLLVDLEGSQWRGATPAILGITNWLPSDFVRETAGPFALSTTPSGVMRVGWRIVSTTNDVVKLRSCSLKISSSPIGVALFNKSTSPLPLITPAPMPVAYTPMTVDQRSWPRVVVSENNLWMNSPSWRSSWSAWAQQEFPDQFAITMGGNLSSRLAEGVSEFRNAGVWPMFEGFKSYPYRTSWLVNNQCYQVAASGFTPSQQAWGDWSIDEAMLHHSEDTTVPELLQSVRDEMNAAFDLGFPSYTIMDYVWPYTKGRWGYSASALAKWKEYLSGQGPSLNLVGPEEVMSFADYWARFSSQPLTPASFGWSSWNDFVCGREELSGNSPQEFRRLMLFNALWHFHYLVFIQQAGDTAVERGRDLMITVNPESLGNGVDHALLSRVGSLASLGVEFFGSPRQVFAWRHTLPFLRYREAGPFVDLVGEINYGGHGSSRYDLNVAFLYYYGCTASVLPRLYNTQYLSGTLWTSPATLDAYHKARFDHWFAGANAFLARHDEEARQPVVRDAITVVSTRSILDYQATSSGSLQQQENLAGYLQDLNVTFDQVGRDMWRPSQSVNTKVLVWTPRMNTQGEFSRARQWVESGSGRTLLIHGGSGWWYDYQPALGVYTDPLSLLVGRIPLFQDRTISYQGQNFWCRWWDSVGFSEVLLTADDGSPLVRRWAVGANQIVHILPDLPAQNYSTAQRNIVQCALEAANVVSFANYSDAWMLSQNEVPGGNSLIAYQKAKLADQEQQNYYCREALPTTDSISVKVMPSTQYVVYSVLGQQRMTVTSNASGYLTIPLQASAELIYYGTSTPAFEDTISGVATAYASSVAGTRVAP